MMIAALETGELCTFNRKIIFNIKFKFKTFAFVFVNYVFYKTKGIFNILIKKYEMLKINQDAEEHSNKLIFFLQTPIQIKLLIFFNNTFIKIRIFVNKCV